MKTRKLLEELDLKRKWTVTYMRNECKVSSGYSQIRYKSNSFVPLSSL